MTVLTIVSRSEYFFNNVHLNEQLSEPLGYKLVKSFIVRSLSALACYTHSGN